MPAGRTALVTGSTSGIGLGVARALALAGANVIANGRTPPGQVHEILAGIGPADRVAYVAADLATQEGCERLAREAQAAFGPIDILVNNAGVQHVAPLERFPPEKWDLILALNLSAAFHMTRLLLGSMTARGFGRIVNMASAHALVASPFKAAYVAAKHGLLGLTKTTALEAAEKGVTCNAVCPGYVLTPLVEKQIDDQARSHGIPRERVMREVILAPHPDKQFATVEDVAALTLFLCSDAAKSITGAALPIEGGWTAR